MSQRIGLPEHISEIHFGFLSGKHYIGTVDVSHCTNIQITFNDGGERLVCDLGRITLYQMKGRYDKMNNFAKRLNQTMTERAVSQKDLAAAIGKGKSSVSQYLSGRSVPRPEVQAKIAAFLGCTIEWLNSEVPEADHTDKGLKNISVEQCAKLLGKSEQFVRVALQTGAAPFGFAVKNKTEYSYHISPKQLYEYIGSLTI